MNTLSTKEAQEKIKKILDVEYERMHPFETERELGNLLKEAEEKNNE